MVKGEARPSLLTSVFMLMLLPASLASLTVVGGSRLGEAEVKVVYFRDYVVYDSSSINACGVNYVVKPSLKLWELVTSSGVRALRETSPSLLAEAVGMLRSSLERALGESGVSGRILAGSMPVGEGRVLFAVVSVPESSDVTAISGALGEAARSVESVVGADVIVVLQVVPDDLFGSPDASGLREAVETVRKALFEAIEVAGGGGEASSSEVARIADALKRLGGEGGVRALYIEWPEPEHHDPPYISIDIAVAGSNPSKEAVEDLIGAIRGLIGCDYPLVLGLADFPLTRPDVLVVEGDKHSDPPGGYEADGTKVEGDSTPKSMSSTARGDAKHGSPDHAVLGAALVLALILSAIVAAAWRVLATLSRRT